MEKLSKNKKKEKEIFLILLSTFLWNQSVYCGARWIANSWKHFNMTTYIDQLIPFLSWTVSIYLGCYLFWGINYFLCATQNKSERQRFFCADALAKGICFLLFLLIPTTNIRPEITGETFWDNLMILVYQLDAADNLFPSIHCLVSWLSWIGVRKRKDISIYYRYFSLVMAIAVCISTLTTKQHVIIDVIGGILLAEVSYLISGCNIIRNLVSTTLSMIKKHLIL